MRPWFASINAFSKPSERVILKRQRKIVEEDFVEAIPRYSRLGDVYVSVIADKVMAATAKHKKKAFKTAVEERCSAAMTTEDGEKKTWCHVFGDFFPRADVKVVHLIPKSLMSEELSYMLGVGEETLSGPRNGKTSPLVIVFSLPPERSF